MTREELAESLARLSVETGSLVCLGCGYKNSCGTHGCAILRAAMETICSTALEQDGVRPIDANRLESSIQHIIDTCAGDFNKAIFAMFLDYIKQASTITPPNEPLTLEQCKQKKYIWFDSLNDWAKVTNYGVLFFGTEDYRTWEELKENGFGEKYRAYCHPPEGEV